MSTCKQATRARRRARQNARYKNHSMNKQEAKAKRREFLRQKAAKSGRSFGYQKKGK